MVDENKVEKIRKKKRSWCCLIGREGEEIFLLELGILHLSPLKINLSELERKLAWKVACLITKLPQFNESHLHFSSTWKTYLISLSFLFFCFFYALYTATTTITTTWNNMSKFILYQGFFSFLFWAYNILYILYYI